MKASDNEFPSLLLKEGTTPATPGAGDQRLFVRSSDHVLCYVNSSGTVTPVSSGGLADQGVFTYLDGTVAAAPATPATGKLRLYAKTGKVLAVKDDAGLETVLGQGIADQGNVATYLDFSDQGSDPASPAASHHRIYAKAGGFYDKDSSGTVVGAFGAGGGAPTLAYFGYNTIGGSTEALINERSYLKKVTLTAGQVVMSVEAYLQQSADVVNAIIAAVWTDNAGAPQYLRMYGGYGGQSVLLAEGSGGPRAARWIGGPLNFYVPSSGDYWIGCFGSEGGGTIAYDGSGSDRHFDAGGVWTSDYGRYTPTTTTNKYSIRALVMG